MPEPTPETHAHRGMMAEGDAYQAFLTRDEYNAEHSLSQMVLASGWTDYGGNHGGLSLTRSGQVVIASALFRKGAGDVAVINGNPIQLATVPEGFRPHANAESASIVAPSAGTSHVLCRISIIAATGAVLFVPMANATIVANTGWVSMDAVWRTP